MDIQSLSREEVAGLIDLLPTDDECKVFKQFDRDGVDTTLIPMEDYFLLRLSRIKRLKPKLRIMEVIGSFQVNLSVRQSIT
jgi:hypothetical protein